MKYEDLLELLEFAEDHLKLIKGMLSPSLNGSDIDIMTAHAVYAKIRLDQFTNAVFLSEQNGRG